MRGFFPFALLRVRMTAGIIDDADTPSWHDGLSTG
jgi:hypothetical protein